MKDIDGEEKEEDLRRGDEEVWHFNIYMDKCEEGVRWGVCVRPCMLECMRGKSVNQSTRSRC